MCSVRGERGVSLFRGILAKCTYSQTNRQIVIDFFLWPFVSKDDLENAKYISRLFATRHKFYKQNKICTE